MSDQSAKSICLLRLSALGDITHILPVVRTLQESWPDCKITWIIGKVEYQLLEGMDDIEFIQFDKSRGLKAYADLYMQLRGRRFDILLHMQAALRASLASLLVRAPLKVGFDRARAIDFQWIFTNAEIEAKARQHVLDGFFGFLECIGIHQRIMRWQPPIPESAKAYARRHLSDTQAILVINPSSSARRNNFRNWRTQYYARVADYASEVHSMQVVLTGGPAETEGVMAESICEQARFPILNLVGRTSIKQMLAILAKADLVLAPDTGPAHMATAVGTKVIGLYVTSNPMRSGPYKDLDAVVNLYPQAIQRQFGRAVSEVKWGQRVRDPDVVDLITVESVIRQMEESLSPGDR